MDKATGKYAPGKLSYKLQRELDTLPQRIEDTETALEALQQIMGRPEFFRQDGTTIKNAQQRLITLEHDLEHLFKRWETLEETRSRNS